MFFLPSGFFSSEGDFTYCLRIIDSGCITRGSSKDIFIVIFRKLITKRDIAQNFIDLYVVQVLEMLMIRYKGYAIYDVILPLQEHRALCKSREKEHRAEKNAIF